VSDVTEILQDDTYEAPVEMEGVNVRTGSRIPPPGRIFQFLSGGISPAPIKISSPNLAGT